MSSDTIRTQRMVPTFPPPRLRGSLRATHHGFEHMKFDHTEAFWAKKGGQDDAVSVRKRCFNKMMIKISKHWFLNNGPFKSFQWKKDPVEKKSHKMPLWSNLQLKSINNGDLSQQLNPSEELLNFLGFLPTCDYQRASTTWLHLRKESQELNLRVFRFAPTNKSNGTGHVSLCTSHWSTGLVF